MSKYIALISILLIEYLFFISNVFCEENPYELDSLEKYIYVINIKDYDTKYAVIAYKSATSEELYLPFDTFIKAVDFPIEVSNLTAKGQFFSNNSISIDLNTNKILVNNKKIEYDKNSIKLENNRMYFSISLLKKIFSIKINVDVTNLELNIDGKATFSIETKSYKINNRKNNLYPYSVKKDLNYKTYSRLFSYPTIDFLASHRNVKSLEGKYHENSYSTAIGGVIFDLDANIYNNVTYSSNPYYPKKVNTTTMNFSRYLPYNKQNGSLKYFAFGDIYSNGNVFINSGLSGRGLTFSSFENQNINQDKTINIRDVLLPGWEVELYYNNLLIGYKTQADSNGYYNFSNVPVYSGLNIFKLIFYGPFGEKRIEEKRILIGASPVTSGEFAYNVSFVQEGHKIVENDIEKEYAKTNETNDISSNVNLYYGIFDNLAITTGYSRLHDSLDKKILYNFYNAGLIYSIGGFSFENIISQRENNNNLAYKASISGSLDSFGYIYSSYDSFNKIKSPASYMSNLLIDDYIQFRYNNYLSLGSFSLPFNLGYKRYKYEEEQDFIQPPYEHIFYATSSYFIYNNIYATLEYSFDKFYYNKSILKGIINSNLGSVLLRAYYEKNLKPISQNNAFGANINYNFNSYSNAYIQIDRYFNDKIDNLQEFDTYFQAGVSTLLPLGKINISYISDMNNYYEVNISYGLSLGYNQNGKSIYYKSTTPLNNSGNIIAKVFVDNNKNGIYDKKIDTPIKNAKIKINSSDEQQVSDKNGNIYATALASYNSMTVSIDEESIEDIMLVPKVKQYNLILRPSVLQPLTFPFVKSGYIEGSIKNKSNTCNTIIVTAQNSNNVISKTTPDEDGLFLIEVLPYGNYNIQVDCNSQTYKKTIKIDNYINYVNFDIST